MDKRKPSGRCSVLIDDEIAQFRWRLQENDAPGSIQFFFCTVAPENPSSRDVKKHCKVDDASCRLLESAIDKLGLSARAYNRILKIARTIADLEKSADITVAHISEAIQYRNLDRGKQFK